MSENKIEAVTVSLQEPLEIAGKTYNEITLKKPYAGNLKGISLTQLQAGETTQTIKFISKVSDLPVDAIERLSLSDFNAINTLVLGFLYPQSLKDILEGLKELGTNTEIVRAQ